MIEIRSFLKADQEKVVELWRECGLVAPWNDPHRDIERKLAVQPDLLLVGLMGEVIVATVMVGYEGHRGWINYLAVSPSRQRQGIGRKMMEAAEIRLRAMGCPKINLQVRKSNTGVIDFYQRIGFSEDEVVSLGKRLVVDSLHPESPV